MSYMEVVPPAKEEGPAGSKGYVLAERSKLSLAAALCITASVLSLISIVAIGPMLSRLGSLGSRTQVYGGALTVVLLVGLVAGALSGHILGLVAYSKERIRSGAQPGKGLAGASIIGGVLLLLTSMLLLVIMGDTFVRAIGYL